MNGPLSILLVLLAQPAGPTPALEELLRKLAETEARTTRFQRESEVTLTTVVEELDKDGKVEHTNESVLRLTERDGKPYHEVVRASRDGRDTRAEEQRNQDGKGGGKVVRMELASPFKAEVQPGYAFQLLGPDAKEPSLLRLRFGPRGKPSKDLWIGEAVVDPERGDVRWMKQHPSEMPAFTDRLEVEMDFGFATEAGRVISSSRMEGEGGILFFRKRIRMQMRFSDWAPKQRPAR